ncbi:unnamed protein product [Heterobilharzia americana]|nr:unnamed protein product [Heterobilharzia americana]
MIDSRAAFSANTRRRRQHHSRPFNNNNSSNPDSFVVIPRSRHVCSFTLELCIAANLLQLLFLIARLDNWIRSNWIVTFIPSFILLAMDFCFVWQD